MKPTIKEVWKARSTSERIAAVLQLVISISVVVIVLLRLAEVFVSTPLLCALLGTMSLLQAYLFRRTDRTTTVISVCCGSLMLVCSLAILLLEVLMP